MINIRVPARICFYGDHQDYLGLPVIAGTINRFIHLEANPIDKPQFVIQMPDIGKARTIDLADDAPIEQDDYLRAALTLLRKEGAVFNQGYAITISGNIPVNAGLSSSSALVVCWIRFLVAAQKEHQVFSDERIAALTYAAEVTFFNQHGGLMDQYTIALGGLIFIDTHRVVCQRLNPQMGILVVAESGLAKQTMTVLKNARAYAQNAINAVKKQEPNFDIRTSSLADYDRYKAVVPKDYLPFWYAALHNYDLTLQAKALLESQPADPSELGGLMNAHQHLLETYIQNTPESMVKQLQAARAAGALGTKIIGSGGGGCMVALVEASTKDAVIEAFLQAGAKAAYEVQLTQS